jgi:hypothetical protein
VAAHGARALQLGHVPDLLQHGTDRRHRKQQCSEHGCRVAGVRAQRLGDV